MAMEILDLKFLRKVQKLTPQISSSPFTGKLTEIMVPAPDNDPFKPIAYRIPYMERLGQNKILKGTISVTFLYLFYSTSRHNQI